MLSTLADLLSSLDAADPLLADALSRLRSTSSTTPHPIGPPADLRPPNARPGAPAPYPPTADRLVWSGSVPSAETPPQLSEPPSYTPHSDADGLVEVSAGSATAADDMVIALLDRAVRLAYECGLRAGGAAAGHVVGRASLRGFTRVFDLLVEGVLFVDGDGRVAYMNPALARALHEDDGHDALLLRMRQLASSLPRPADVARESVAASSEVRTATARYLLRAMRVQGDVAGLQRAAVVTLERLTPQLPPAESLVDRFGLTTGEARVALLLTQGYSNSGVARKMEISPHTARHHTESVLLKLDVHSRAEVGPKVLGTRRPSVPVRVV